MFCDALATKISTGEMFSSNFFELPWGTVPCTNELVMEDFTTIEGNTEGRESGLIKSNTLTTASYYQGGNHG